MDPAYGILAEISLLNGRDISVEQRQRDIERLKHGGQRGKKQYRLSPAATERARELREANGGIIPESSANGDRPRLPEFQPGHRSLASGSQQPRDLPSHRNSEINSLSPTEQRAREADERQERGEDDDRGEDEDRSSTLSDPYSVRSEPPARAKLSNQSLLEPGRNRRVDRGIRPTIQHVRASSRSTGRRDDTRDTELGDTHARVDQEIGARRLDSPLPRLDPQRRARGLGTRSDGEPLSKDSNEPNSVQTSDDNAGATPTDAHEPTQRTLHSATNNHRAEGSLASAGPPSSTTPRDRIPGSWPGTEPRLLPRTTTTSSTTAAAAAATAAFHERAAASRLSRASPSSSSTATPFRGR
ncbi:hypothetical protein Pst134EA_000385 [Puccinia striiformis f. sp. tritici]|uniref:hypothetical protein n=1 Tax=Puccinia striiformis f. sp. tritici TaxID=168172 RepID=UPI002008B8B4|nr:hypothetical protein Pst134EA_000385 [Puccinia striiformis f. sp. tritici]KAH9473314.1 hypothetical protein Pst134EA_000385 [Puccinia striiformis f. sp. tritici]